MWAWLIALVGSILGAVAGFFGPVLVCAVFHIGTGSYEDVMFVWLATVPGGFGLGGWLGYRLGGRLDQRQQVSE